MNTKIIGKIRAISTSKIKKIIAIKKKCRENGRREDDFGSKPHSKGEHFSRSKIVFLERIVAKIIMIQASNRRIKPIVNIIKIIYTIIL